MRIRERESKNGCGRAAHRAQHVCRLTKRKAAKSEERGLSAKTVTERWSRSSDSADRFAVNRQDVDVPTPAA